MAEMLTQLGFPTPSQLLDQQYAFFQIRRADRPAVCAEVTGNRTPTSGSSNADNAGQASVTLQYAKTIASAITRARPTATTRTSGRTPRRSRVWSPRKTSHDGRIQTYRRHLAGSCQGTQNAEDGTFTATISSAYNADNTMISRKPASAPATDMNTGSSSTARRGFRL